MEAKKTFGWGRKLLVLVALLPIGLATAANWVGATAQPINYQRTSPALVFRQYLVNLGNIPATSQKYVYTRFVFTNRGKETVKITDMKPSCGCLQPRLAKKVFAPGERGEFLLRVETASQKPGAHDYFVTMKYTDPKPREATVHFKFVLPEKQIDIQPHALIFYQLNGEPATQEFVITDHRDRQMDVKKVTVTSEFVKAVISSNEINANNHRQVKISVTVQGKIPTGKHQVRVIVETDDPVYGNLTIPLWIQGPAAQQAGKVKEKN